MFLVNSTKAKMLKVYLYINIYNNYIFKILPHLFKIKLHLLLLHLTHL